MVVIFSMLFSPPNTKTLEPVFVVRENKRKVLFCWLSLLTRNKNEHKGRGVAGNDCVFYFR